MNLGFLRGVLSNIDYSISNIGEVLSLEDNKLNYESEKKLLSTVVNLKSLGTMIHCIIMAEETKVDDKNKEI